MLNSATGNIFRFGMRERPRGEFGDDEELAKAIDYINSVPALRATAGKYLRSTTPITAEQELRKTERKIKNIDKAINIQKWKAQRGISIDDKSRKDLQRKIKREMSGIKK